MCSTSVKTVIVVPAIPLVDIPVIPKPILVFLTKLLIASLVIDFFLSPVTTLPNVFISAKLTASVGSALKLSRSICG